MLFEIIGGILNAIFENNEKYQKVYGKAQEGLGKLENYAYEQQDKMNKAEARMADKTDKQLKDIATSRGGSYSSIEKQAAYNEYKSRHNK
ncbi:MAG: hypothetical protein IJZ07_07670 [Clostridia bacterium]|nr:hypothetical protein [Clostridia bacterium]